MSSQGVLKRSSLLMFGQGFLATLNRSTSPMGSLSKGDLLFVIDPRPFEAAVDLEQANVARFESELELAILELKRAERLLPNKNIAREEYDSRVANKKVQEAQLRAAKAELRSAELDLAYTEVRAPISGRISSAEVDEGNLIEAATGASTRLTTIVLAPQRKD